MGGGIIRILSTTLILASLAACAGEAGNMQTFAEQVSRCVPAELTTDQALGAEGRYEVEGPDEDGCRVSFTFTRNPDPDLVGRSLSFVVNTEGSVASQLRDGVAACLEGRSGEFRCEGDLFEAAGGTTERSSGGPLPCGEAVKGTGDPLYPMPGNGAWGFVNGNWIIEPQWDRVQFFS